MPTTLTQVLARRDVIRLYGQRVSDLTPRGNLGLPLDPDGPAGFAVVRAYSRDGVTRALQPPRLLSVHGEGEAPGADDPDALPGEQVWTARAQDPALCLSVRRARLQALLKDATAGKAAAAGDDLDWCSTSSG